LDLGALRERRSGERDQGEKREKEVFHGRWFSQ
jgi:hypothetical protein